MTRSRALPPVTRACTAALLLVLAACAEAQDSPAPAAPPPGAASRRADEPTLLVNGILNGGFEWVADSTTDPPKYGAYWFGAFAPIAEDATCSVIEDRPYRGSRCLRLSHVTPDAVQKIVADPRWTEHLTVALAVRTLRRGILQVTLEDGTDRRTTVHIQTGDQEVTVTDPEGAPIAPLLARDEGPHEEGETPWWRVELDLGARFTAEHGSPPVPRLNLRLSCTGQGGALADVDDVSVGMSWPAIDAARLAADIEALVLHNLDTFYLPRGKGGLQLVDPETGYVTVTGYDVETGGDLEAAQTASFHTIHTLLIHWLRECHRRGSKDQIARWTPELERITRTLLARNFHPVTGLPRTVTLGTLAPNDNSPATIGAYVDFLLDARELLPDAELRAQCLAQCRHIADTLIALQRAHDLPPDKAPPPPQWNATTGRFDGDTSNWFGHIPDRLTAMGEIETDKRFYASWAILSGRSFWYEFMRSPCAVMRVSDLDPKEGDLAAMHGALSKFHRDWDASRYDLENDTDDHYGHVCKDLLGMIEHSGGKVPDALALVQEATDHRLERATTSAGDTLWVQAVRLGTACAGDSPRALLDVVKLYELPPALNPQTSGLPLYRDALLELAQNDLKGRQLTNGQFTESFFKNWEMVCICYRGTYQGDCREQPPEYWHGDVGDTFGGPPTSGIDAQAVAYRVANAALRPQILAGLGVVQHITDAALARPYGYMFGLDPAVARQYELPEKYTIGLSPQSLSGLGYAMAWMRLLPRLDTAPLPPAPVLEWVQSPLIGRALKITAPAGFVVALPHSERPFPAPISERDGRMLALDLADAPEGLAGAYRVTVGPNGEAHVPVAQLPFATGTVQPLLLDSVSGEPLVIGAPFRLDG